MILGEPLAVGYHLENDEPDRRSDVRPQAGVPAVMADFIR
jgi:hypothetical protein